VRGASTRCGGFDKQRDALAALEEIRSRDRRGVDVTRRVTVGGYLTEWLAGKRNLRATTLRSYRQHVEDYLVPHLGRLDITALRRAHVEAMFAAIDTEREQPGRRPMGAATKQRVRATLRSALHDAEREGLVTVNAARLVRLEAGRRPQVRPLEPDELGRLLDHLAGDELGPLFETITATGLRRGEALGLRWSDVDLDRGVIAVRQQLVTLGGAESFQPPKTASGARRIELDSHTTGLLLDQRLRQDTDREAWGDAYVDRGLVLARANGEPLSPNLVTKRFGEWCDSAWRAPGPAARPAARRGVAAAGGRGRYRDRVQDPGALDDRHHRRHVLPSAGGCRAGGRRACRGAGAARGEKLPGDCRAPFGLPIFVQRRGCRGGFSEPAGQRRCRWCPRWGSNPHWADF
jgi:integrase